MLLSSIHAQALIRTPKSGLVNNGWVSTPSPAKPARIYSPPTATVRQIPHGDVLLAQRALCALEQLGPPRPRVGHVRPLPPQLTCLMTTRRHLLYLKNASPLTPHPRHLPNKHHTSTTPTTAPLLTSPSHHLCPDLAPCLLPAQCPYNVGSLSKANVSVR